VEFAAGIPQLLKGEFTEEVGIGVDSYSIRQLLVAIIESVRNRLTWSGMKRKNRAKCQPSSYFASGSSDC